MDNQSNNQVPNSNTVNSNEPSSSDPANPNQQVQKATVPPISVNTPSQPEPTSDPLLTEKTYNEDLDSQWNNWKCLECHYVYEGVKSKTTCPKCGNSDPDRFGD